MPPFGVLLISNMWQVTFLNSIVMPDNPDDSDSSDDEEDDNQENGDEAE
jgi:hypothetical protein